MTLLAGVASLSFDNSTPPVPDFTGSTGLAGALIVALQPFRIPATSATHVHAMGSGDQTLIFDGNPGTPGALAARIANLEDECEAMAVAIVDHLKNNALVSVTIAQNAIDSGIPSTLRTVNGGIT